MRQVVRFDDAEVAPDRAQVLRSQGIPEGASVPGRIQDLLERAIVLFDRLAEPRGLFEEVTGEEFERVLHGEGQNAPESPLEEIFPKAEGLALFAATLGGPISHKIRELFGDNDLALGYMLDSVASEAADTLSTRLAQRFVDALRARGAAGERTRVLPYSPGYCGWHISGQGRLFGRLRPGEVGIELNDSFLMLPMKSVSGVLVTGPGKIHKFRADFSFCESCQTHACRERMASVLSKPSGETLQKGRGDGNPEADL